MRSSGPKDIDSFLKEKGLKTLERRLYLELIKNEKGTVIVGTLRRFCEQFDINLDEIEQRGLISQPYRYPIDMKSRGFVKMKTHVLDEGAISPEYKLRYTNQDPVLLKPFADSVREAGGTTSRKLRMGRHAIDIHANPVLARALEASGLPRGRKTISNPPLDPMVEKDSELQRHHIQATLTEEGWFSLTVDERRARFDIAWGRSVDITDKLSSKEIDELRQIEEKHGRKIPIRRVEDPEIREIIEQRPPRSLDQEVTLLKTYHPEKEWPPEHPTKVHVSRENRVTAFWEVHVLRADLMDLIHDEYGMLSGTWKAERFQRLYQAYVKYRARELTDEEIQEVRKIKEENPPNISANWISEKVQELFPGTEWANDIKRIRSML